MTIARDTYEVEIAGVRRELPLFEVAHRTGAAFWRAFDYPKPA